MNALQFQLFSQDPATWLNTTANHARFQIGGGSGHGNNLGAPVQVGGHNYAVHEFPRNQWGRQAYLTYNNDPAQGPVGVNANITNAINAVAGTHRVPASYLHWNADRVYYMRLAWNSDFFATAPMNGCCVFVGGTAMQPVVVHANISDVIPLPVLNDFAATKAAQLLVYGQVYAALQVQLQNRGILTGNVTVFDPAFYMEADYGGGRGAVWGIRRLNGWTFYYSMEVQGPPQKAYVLGCLPWGVRMQDGQVYRPQRSVAGELWPHRDDPTAIQDIADFIAGD